MKRSEFEKLKAFLDQHGWIVRVAANETSPSGLSGEMRFCTQPNPSGLKGQNDEIHYHLLKFLIEDDNEYDQGKKHKY